MWQDSETELDFLDYGYLVNSMESIIMNDDLLPACIGLYGDWGSGKSSLIRMCKKQIEQEDEGAICLIFNGWLFESYDDAKSAILGEILDTLKDNTKLTDKGKKIIRGLFKSIDKLKLAGLALQAGADFLLTGGVGATVSAMKSLTISTALSGVSKALPNIPEDQLTKTKEYIENELNYKDLRDDIREFQRQFAELLEDSKISRLVVFIDELDRCRPDTILDTFEAIKLFLFTGKTAFVIGADERQIRYAVKTKFADIPGQELDIGKEYLEKLVQYPIQIPRLDDTDVRNYLACLFLQQDLDKKKFDSFIDAFHKSQKEDFTKVDLYEITKHLGIDRADSLITAQQLATMMTQVLKGNPRQCKRFLNMMDLRLSQAKYRGKELDRKILCKVMMLEYYRPTAFRKFAELSHTPEFAPNLAAIESGEGFEKLNGVLGDYGSDPWFAKWFETEPHLADKDLSLYFYFSRTSLEERLSLLTATMSPEAQRILKNLLSDKDLDVDKALKGVQQVPVHEAESVMEAFGNQLLSSEKIDTSQLKKFLTFAEAREELYKAGMDLISKFSADQLSIGAAAYIGNFAKETKQVSAARDLAENNWKGNKNLSKALLNSLK